jgi:hypothetical protein
LASTSEAGEKTRLSLLSLQNFRRAFELDLSQTDLLLKIAELMLSLPIEDQGKARFVCLCSRGVFAKNAASVLLRAIVS